jgi:hypothetical protein
MNARIASMARIAAPASIRRCRRDSGMSIATSYSITIIRIHRHRRAAAPFNSAHSSTIRA